jgi:putative aldouronate transport system permease protein
LIDTIWALVLPGAVPVFNVILMLNFFRQIPTELEEAALIDGAGHWKTLFTIYVPCSLP